MKSKSAIKKEFDEFAEKIARLESLRAEVEALDTRGFSQDVKVIKAKLKTVDSIGEVEKEIKSLRKKIEAKKIPVSGGDVEKPSNEMNEGTKRLRRKISELEKLIKQKRKVNVRKQLSEKELRYVKDVPKLERELKELKSSFESHRKFSRGKIDTGVGVVVDDRFGDFIRDIKVEISKKVNEKEQAMDERLKADLENREKIFKKKYEDLVNNIQKKHEKELHEGLRTEIAKKFEEKLKNRLEKEKTNVLSDLIKENATRIHEEKMKIMKKLEKSYAEKDQKILQAEIEKLKEEMHSELKKKVGSLKQKKIIEKEMEKKKKGLMEIVHDKKPVEKHLNKHKKKKAEKEQKNQANEEEKIGPEENEIIEEKEVEEKEDKPAVEEKEIEFEKEELKEVAEEKPTKDKKEELEDWMGENVEPVLPEMPKNKEVDLGLPMRAPLTGIGSLGNEIKKDEELTDNPSKENGKGQGFFSKLRKKIAGK